MIDGIFPVRVLEMVDLLIVWAFLWVGIVWARATPARFALGGIAALALVYLTARQLDLVLTTWILQSFAALTLLIGVVVFQQDLRRLFEQLAALWLRRQWSPVGSDVVDIITRTLARLVERREGALFVFPGAQALDPHIEGGVTLDGRVSEPLLMSIFDPHSPGHDGAVILAGDRIIRFAAHLPLSTSHRQLGQRGTRHAAALGLSERTDALCIVVSEEQGTVSVAHQGRLRSLREARQAAVAMRDFRAQLQPEVGPRVRRLERLRARWREGALAFLIALVAWLLVVPGATVVETERQVRVTATGVPTRYVVDEIEPTRVRVTLSGPRRDLFFMTTDALEVRVDAILVELGRRSFPVGPENVRHPDGLEVRSVDPDSVRLDLRERPTP